MILAGIYLSFWLLAPGEPVTFNRIATPYPLPHNGDGSLYPHRGQSDRAP